MFHKSINPTPKSINFKQSSDVFRGDFDILDSLDSEASKRIFAGFVKRRPTLDMALREAGIKNHDIVLEDSRIFADAAREDPEIAKLGLSDDEAGAISCYTHQGIADGKSPYQVINEGLAGSRNRTGLSSIGRLLFLLLSGLRKLPRTRPSAGQIFYRGIRAKVPQTRDEANGHQYYEKGRTVTWWGFTSTTTNMEVPYDFIQDAATSTVFHIGGEDLWGYDIKAFSKFVSEDEILLEPEAKVLVNRLKNLGTLLMIEVILQRFNHLALEDIIPVGNASPVPTQIGQASAINPGPEGSFSEIQGKSAIYDQASNTKKKWDCVWKICPDNVDGNRKYSVDEKNPRVATKIVRGCCTIIGNTYIPLNKVTSWNIKIVNSERNNGKDIFIGIAPSNINQNVYNCDKCGWYFNCYGSILWSGPPHNYRRKGYGPRKKHGQYVHTGDSVGVVMDTTRGDLSFVLNGVNLGVAYTGIPLDKPLVPCVLLCYHGDSAELDTSEVKGNEVNSSIPVPSNVIVKGTTWDSIILTWDEVVDASFYQIEVDGSNSGDATTKNNFIKRGLLPETEHSFRVRIVRGSSVSEWSDVVKGRTLKVPKFSECVWKKCPDDVDNNRKYSVGGKNPRIATKVNSDGSCTIIGNTHIPLNKVTSWNIKILKSRDNNGRRILIGITPNDINQNDDNYDNGWYFDCYASILHSGPPHNYKWEEYGPRKRDGHYVHTGDSVGVAVDTINGELSFVLNGVNLGVAYKGIPLDKPLIPCAILLNKDDSVELIV